MWKLGRILGLGLFTILAIACSGGAGPDGPEATVRDFYNLLNDGRYTEAKNLYTAEAQLVINDPEITSDEAFRAWGESETKRGTLEGIRIVDSDVEAGKAQVEVELSYSDGTKVKREAPLLQEDGAWKLGLLG